MFRLYNDQLKHFCLSFDDDEKLAIMVIIKPDTEDVLKALNRLENLEHYLAQKDMKFETTKGHYFSGCCGVEKTNAIIIDLALPGAFKKITGIFDTEKPNKGS